MSKKPASALDHLQQLYAPSDTKQKRGEGDADDTDKNPAKLSKIEEDASPAPTWSSDFVALFVDVQYGRDQSNRPVGDYDKGTGRNQAWLADAEKYAVYQRSGQTLEEALAANPDSNVPKNASKKEKELALEAWEWFYLYRRFFNDGDIYGVDELMPLRIIDPPTVVVDADGVPSDSEKLAYKRDLNAGVDSVVVRVHGVLARYRLLAEQPLAEAPYVEGRIERRYANGKGRYQREAERLFRDYVPPTMRPRRRVGRLMQWAARVYRDAAAAGFFNRETYQTDEFVGESPDDGGQADGEVLGRALVNSLLTRSGIDNLTRDMAREQLPLRLDLFIDNVVVEARRMLEPPRWASARVHAEPLDNALTAYGRGAGVCQGLLNHVWRWEYKPFADDADMSVAGQAVAQIHRIHYGLPTALVGEEARLLAAREHEFLVGSLLRQAATDLTRRSRHFAVSPAASATTLTRMEFSADLAVAGQLASFWAMHQHNFGVPYWVGASFANRLASLSKMFGIFGSDIRFNNVPFIEVARRQANEGADYIRVAQFYYVPDQPHLVIMRRQMNTIAYIDDVSGALIKVNFANVIGQIDTRDQETDLARTTFGLDPE